MFYLRAFHFSGDTPWMFWETVRLPALGFDATMPRQTYYLEIII